jgi:hypothetical protein
VCSIRCGPLHPELLFFYVPIRLIHRKQRPPFPKSTMAKITVPFSVFLVLFLTMLQSIYVHSTEHMDLGAMPTEEQQIFGGVILRPGESVICHAKRQLIAHLEQLSFYLKADCQTSNKSFVGCSCFPARCAPQCIPQRVCCAQNTTAFLAELENFNAFYAVHFKDLFAASPPKALQLDE